MEHFDLNISQQNILDSDISSESAINTIGFKLRLYDIDADSVARAVNAVLRSSDIFTATLKTDGAHPFFETESSDIVKCTVMSLSDIPAAEKYAQDMEHSRIPTGGTLYRTTAIPIDDGGTLLCAFFHHVIIDGFGMSLFIQYIFDVLAGKSIPKSVFFKRNDATYDSADDEKFWRGYFNGAEFDTAVQQGDAVSKKKNIRSYYLNAEKAAKVSAFIKSNGISISYVFAAALAIYMTGSTGKKDAVIIMPRLNRSENEMNTIGCYTLIVPVRVTVDPKDDFVTVCKKAQESARSASAHKKCGYGRILRICRDENVISDSLSEGTLNVYARRENTDIKHDVSISVSGAMENQFTWNIYLFNDNTRIDIDGKDGIYDDNKIDYMYQSVCQIADMGIDGAVVRDIPLTALGERKKLMSVKGKTVELDADATMVSMFRDTVQKYPDSPALYASGVSLTFKELDMLSNRIARALMKHGIKSGDKVAFMLKRDYRLIPTMIGILKTGAAFIPVDPSYPVDRIEYMLGNSDAASIVSSSDAVNGMKIEYLEINDILTEQDSSVVDVDIHQGDLAYMIYTSSTTGKPKGVMLSHRGIVNIVDPDNNPFNRYIVPNTRGIVAVGSICFDISLYEIFVLLLNGKFVEFASEDAILDVSALTDLIYAHGADVMHCTPSRLASYMGVEGFRRALGKMKAILSAGEVLPGSLVTELKTVYGINIYNGYGPTETTIGATITEAGDNKTIGYPIANTQILLLSTDNKLVPYGGIGEICVEGPGVGLGYMGLPEQTQKVFTEFEGMRIYKTGDLAHYTDDGRLIYHGRNNRQIKLRGLRIELAEIENCLMSYEGIGMAACAVKTVGQSQHLAAFYVKRQGMEVDKDLLKKHLASQLTPYMVPDVYAELQDMPRTPGGKIDAKALDKIPVVFERQYTAPFDKTQVVICGVMADVLGEDRVGIDDNFFEIGGDSLAAINLLGKLNSALENEKIEYSDLFKYPTPRLLAQKLDEKHEATHENKLADLDYTGIDSFLKTGTFDAVKTHYLGNVLITGVTGYLGIHILVDLLNRPDCCGKIYCLTRAKGRLSIEKRIRNSLFYYAEDDYSEYFGTKWIAVEGDITDENIFKTPIADDIDTVINSAANVAHFAYGDAIEKTNTAGVENLIRFCQKRKAMLCQISTISVGGIYKLSESKLRCTEEDLFVGQEIHNQYIMSKYLAEYSMLRACVDSGLKVKILRVGNLQGRISDGEFQMNMKSNAFTRQISCYVKMRAVPQSVYNATVNFSPVDETARMIVNFITTDDRFKVFHVYPPEEVPFSTMFDTIRELGYEVKTMEDGEFEAHLEELRKTEDGEELVQNLLLEKPNIHYADTQITQNVTTRVMNALDTTWLPITDMYLKKYFSALNDMNMF